MSACRSNWVKPEVYPWLGLNRTVVQVCVRVSGTHGAIVVVQVQPGRLLARLARVRK